MSQFSRAIQRHLIGFFRTITPVLTVGSRVLVFRDADVREIISRDKDFGLAAINGENISRHIGPFVLGMDDGPEYARDKSILKSIVKKEDPERIRSFIRQKAAEAVANLPEEFDVVSQFTRYIPMAMVEDYFGVGGLDVESFLRWNRTLFWDIFLDLKDDPAIRNAANKSAEEMMPYLAELIQSHKQAIQSGARIKDNLLTRLILRQQSGQPSFNDKEIAANISGVYMGALEPTNKAIVNVLNQFFARPKVLAAARKAAQEDDAEGMLRLALEAMRFHPNAPLLMRYAEQDQYIGGNGRKKRKIKGGKTVYAMISSAMFDPRSFPNPQKFDPNRPMADYLYFGMGLHTCYGNYVNYVSIPEMLMALLKDGKMGPVKGKAGKIVFEGPFPDKWGWRRG